MGEEERERQREETTENMEIFIDSYITLAHFGFSQLSDDVNVKALNIVLKLRLE